MKIGMTCSLEQFATATKIWPDKFPNAEGLCREGLEFVRSQWLATA